MAGPPRTLDPDCAGVVILALRRREAELRVVGMRITEGGGGNQRALPWFTRAAECRWLAEQIELGRFPDGER